MIKMSKMNEMNETMTVFTKIVSEVEVVDSIAIEGRSVESDSIGENVNTLFAMLFKESWLIDKDKTNRSGDTTSYSIIRSCDEYRTAYKFLIFDEVKDTDSKSRVIAVVDQLCPDCETPTEELKHMTFLEASYELAEKGWYLYPFHEINMHPLNVRVFIRRG